jgi:hypothetical protein
MLWMSSAEFKIVCFDERESAQLLASGYARPRDMPAAPARNRGAAVDATGDGSPPGG